VSQLRTLTAEEVAKDPRRYAIEELRLRMKVRVRCLELGGYPAEIVNLYVSEPPHEEIWLKFDHIEKPVGPWKPTEIHVLEDAVEHPDTTTGGSD